MYIIYINICLYLYLILGRINGDTVIYFVSRIHEYLVSELSGAGEYLG